jgi:hypothetical protein
MPKTEDGEYELLLGNRQLLSIFFIVVVLLGAGFTLGYMMGRESAATPQVAKQTEPAADKLPDPVDEPPPSAPIPAPAVAEPGIAKPSAAPTEERTGVATPYRTGVPPAGSSFLQIAAVSKQDAEMQAKSLSAKGFPMWIAPNETNPDLFSVLVGPYVERGDLAKAKLALEELGFRKSFRKDFK